MPAQTLLSFRAGKMSREADTSNTVLPDERKGYVQLLNEDELLHFQWKERNATDPEDDLIIFPDDARFLRVAEAVDGRVYMLRFESSKAKHFFWMQDKSEARDTWLVDRVNSLINDPDAPAEPEPAAEPDTSNAMANVLTGLSRQPGPSPPISDDLLNSTLSSFPGGPTAFWDGMAASGIGREDLMQMLSGDPNALRDSLLTVPRDAPAPTAASASSPLFAAAQEPEASGGLSSNLQERLAELTAGLPGGAGGSQREYMGLNDVLSRDVLARVLEMPDIGERLRPGLPENWEEQGHNVSDAVQSPQFQQALSSLSSALGTGQLAPLLQQFGLHGGIDDVESFLRAVEEQVRREQGEGGAQEDPQDGDRMQED